MSNHFTWLYMYQLKSEHFPLARVWMELPTLCMELEFWCVVNTVVKKKKVNRPGVANNLFPIMVRQLLLPKWSQKEYTHFNREKIFCTFRAVNFLFFCALYVMLNFIWFYCFCTISPTIRLTSHMIRILSTNLPVQYRFWQGWWIKIASTFNLVLILLSALSSHLHLDWTSHHF